MTARRGELGVSTIVGGLSVLPFALWALCAANSANAASTPGCVNGGAFGSTECGTSSATNNAASATAIGYGARAAAVGTALGVTTEAGTGGVALGANATVSPGSTAVGTNSAASAVNSVAVGNASTNTRANTVSVGRAGSERQITNVAAGTQATDALNVGQLSALTQRLDTLEQLVETLNQGLANGAILATTCPQNWTPMMPDDVQTQSGMKLLLCARQSAAQPAPRGRGTQSGNSAQAWMTGTFDTDFGVLTLTPQGGTYSVNDGHVIVANVSGDVMAGTWTQSRAATRCADGTYHGAFTFRFNAQGFVGSYGYCDDPPTAGRWNGTRRP